MLGIKETLAAYGRDIGKTCSFEFGPNTRNQKDLIVTGVLVAIIDVVGTPAAVLVDGEYLYLVKFPPHSMRFSPEAIKLGPGEVDGLGTQIRKISDIISLCKPAASETSAVSGMFVTEPRAKSDLIIEIATSTLRVSGAYKTFNIRNTGEFHLGIPGEDATLSHLFWEHILWVRFPRPKSDAPSAGGDELEARVPRPTVPPSDSTGAEAIPEAQSDPAEVDSRTVVG